MYWLLKNNIVQTQSYSFHFSLLFNWISWWESPTEPCCPSVQVMVHSRRKSVLDLKSCASDMGHGRASMSRFLMAHRREKGFATWSLKYLPWFIEETEVNWRTVKEKQKLTVKLLMEMLTSSSSCCLSVADWSYAFPREMFYQHTLLFFYSA